jgi:hypothetical protein
MGQCPMFLSWHYISLAFQKLSNSYSSSNMWHARGFLFKDSNTKTWILVLDAYLKISIKLFFKL